jgi:hypothetical protein
MGDKVYPVSVSVAIKLLSCIVIYCHVLSLCFLFYSFPPAGLIRFLSLSLSLSLSIVPFLLPAVPHSPNDLVYSLTPVPYFAL